MIHQGVHMTSKKLKVENWPIEKLIPYARNPRKNDQAVEQVAAAIKEFGFRVPIVAKSDGLLVDGHLHLKAAQKLGLKEVPVVLADDLSDAQIKAFRISVNRMAELAEWDNELLALEFSELKDLGFDTSLTGFDELQLSTILKEPNFEPGTEDDQGKLDEKTKQQCPNCGHEF
jgi:ParB-like chromosome segregation protein Spo0J